VIDWADKTNLRKGSMVFEMLDFRFCPSVFLYLCSVVPAIWIIEVDKFDRNLLDIKGMLNGTTMDDLAIFQNIGGVSGDLVYSAKLI